MAFTDDYDFHLLKNEAEKLVINELEMQLKNVPSSVCRCNDCIIDMAAIAMNTVKPLYRYSLLGSMYTSQAMHEDSYADSVKKAVSQAITKVRKNPSHD